MFVEIIGIELIKIEVILWPEKRLNLKVLRL